MVRGRGFVKAGNEKRWVRQRWEGKEEPGSICRKQKWSPEISVPDPYTSCISRGSPCVWGWASTVNGKAVISPKYHGPLVVRTSWASVQQPCSMYHPWKPGNYFPTFLPTRIGQDVLNSKIIPPAPIKAECSGAGTVRNGSHARRQCRG